MRNLRRQIACAALLLWATATADARAGTPAANEASAAHAEPGWTIVPLDELGLDAYTRRKWRSPTLTMRYRTRLDRVVTAARLRLAFAPGKLDGVTALAIVVNGVRVAELPVGELQPAEATREIAIDPRLLTADNDVTLSWQTARTSNCVALGSWSRIAADSTLEVRQAELSGRIDLRWLPLPFVDPRLDASAEIPFVFAVPPSLAAQRAAFLVASAFALAAPARLSFPVRVGSLPPGNAVVIGTPAELHALGLDGGPALGMIERPGGHGWLLVVRGSDDELVERALRLAKTLASRAPDKELEPGRQISFAELVSREQLTLRGRGDGQVHVPFVLPPATVFWPDGSLPVKMIWEESQARDAPRARIVLTLNGHYVTTLQRAWSVRAPGVHEARFRLPQAYLRRYNELTLSRETEPTDACPAKHDDELVRVLGDSTLDLRGATEFALLPDLGQLVASGFPFTRARDLAGTAIVAPRAPTPATESASLALAAELARSAGVVPRGAEFVDAGSLPAALDRDLIIVGSVREQPLLSRWNAQRAALPPRGGGLVGAFESPLHRGRTALLLTADGAGAMPDVDLLRASLALDGDRRNVALIADGKLVAREVGHSYALGRLSPLRRVMWFLSRRAYLLLLLLLGGAWWLTRAAFGAAARRARRRLTTLVLLLAVGAAAGARADEAPATILETRALFWERSGRCDKAIEVWQQLSRLAPTSAAAQQGIARCRAGHVSAVDDTKERAVAGARALAAAGKYDEAIAAYDKIFSGAPPEAYALEYDETLAGTRAGRAEAQARLGALAAKHGDAPEYALAYARSLAYAEKTRRDGIARLERLAATVPAVAAKAESAWRSALTWLDANAADRPLFDRYLARHPDDDELVQRRRALDRVSTLDTAVKLGYARLNGGALDDAAETFGRVLARSPKDLHALVGMSWVRLKQARFAEARTLAEAAKRGAPAAATLWQPPLHAALLWIALDEAADAEKHKDWPAAEAALQHAQAVAGRDGALVALRRGRLFLAEGRAAEAEKLLRPLVPAQPDALPPLVEALLSQGKTDEAAEVERQLPPDSDGTGRRLKMAIARARARAAAARGDNATALQTLRQALESDPSDRDTRLELLYRELDVPAVSAALALGEALHRERPDDADVIAALALAQDQNNDDAAALATLKSIDATRLTPDARALRDRLELGVTVRAALETGRGSRQIAARLAALERENEANPELLAVVAAAWWKAGKHERALTTVRKVLAQAPSRATRLRCAGILLDAGGAGAGELSRLLDDLSAEPRLSVRERAQIDAIRTTQLVHAVDDDRRAGEYRRAFLRLDGALSATADAPLLLAALARLQASAGHPRKALAIYDMLVEEDPTDLAFTEGAAFAAVAAGDLPRARKLAAAALEHHANDPRAFLLAGRIALARHDDALGYHLLKLGLERSPAAPAEKPDGDVQLAAARALVADARQELEGDEPSSDEEPPPDEALRSEISALDLRYAPIAGAGVSFRFRSGDPGLSRLFEVDLPLTLQMSPGPRWGRFTALGVPVYLGGQSTDLTDPATADAFGTDGVNTPTTLPLRLSNSVWGFAMALRYEYRDLRLELGSTPIGFRVVDVVGEAGWDGHVGPWTLGLRGFRSAVTDSVLSYSGLRDPSTGIIWGGVRREGGAININFDPGDYVLHLLVSYAAFTGKHVDTNHGGAYSLSGMWRFYRRPRQTVGLGLDAFVMNYAEDLRYFSLGQGGYFSPQLFLLVGLPLTWVAQGDGWTLTAGGESGVNYYFEDASPLFPVDGGLQGIRVANPGLGTQLHGAFYPGIEKVNAYGKVRVDVAVDLGSHFALDAGFDGEFSAAYSQVIFTLAFHKAFPR
ncbi:MAG TPA: cellulose biosynthesis cyclic di-GMP-binding regulatory protein BcsB [Polyangia bacterium]|nr:cellulose biosynthesis cyclic di-GMP-binding regulatory protein BcsB [Polyangia bacterium]